MIAGHIIELGTDHITTLPLHTRDYHISKLNTEPFKVIIPIKWYEESYLGFMSLEKLNAYPILMLCPMDGYFTHETILNYFTSKNLEPNIVL